MSGGPRKPTGGKVPMSYLQILAGRGCPCVGLSADWVNSAYRTDGNARRGEVVTEEGGTLSRIAYLVRDGERVDRELEVVPDLTPAVFAAYCAAADAFTPGNVDPVGCLEQACAVLGLRLWGDEEAEHLTLVCDVAAKVDEWHANGWRLPEVDATDLASLGAVSLGEGRNGLEAIGADGEPMAFLTAGLWLDSSGRNLLP